MLARHCLTYHIISNKPKIFSRIVVAKELISSCFHFRKSPENKIWKKSIKATIWFSGILISQGSHQSLRLEAAQLLPDVSSNVLRGFTGVDWMRNWLIKWGRVYSRNSRFCISSALVRCLAGYGMPMGHINEPLQLFYLALMLEKPLFASLKRQQWRPEPSANGRGIY